VQAALWLWQRARRRALWVGWSPSLLALLQRLVKLAVLWHLLVVPALTPGRVQLWLGRSWVQERPILGLWYCAQELLLRETQGPCC